MPLSPEILINILPALLAASGSALFSGLTIGLSSVDPFELRDIVASKSEDWEKAKKVLKVAKNYNWLLTTLLLGNVAMNVVIPIYLSKVASGPVAGVMSVVLIFIFAELLPAAICKKEALSIGAKTSWLVRTMMILSAPVTWPIGKILDKTVGVEGRSITPRGVLMEKIDAL